MEDQPPTGVEIERALRRAWFPVARVGDLDRPRRVGLVWCCVDDPVVDLPSPAVLDGVEWMHSTGRPMSVAAGPRAATENSLEPAASGA